MTVPLNDVKGQLANQVVSGVRPATPLEWLKEYPRVTLKAIEQRLERSPARSSATGCGAASWANSGHYQVAPPTHPGGSPRRRVCRCIAGCWSEYRVSLFAQQLGTRLPVSDKRLAKQWSQVEG